MDVNNDFRRLFIDEHLMVYCGEIVQRKDCQRIRTFCSLLRSDNLDPTTVLSMTAYQILHSLQLRYRVEQHPSQLHRNYGDRNTTYTVSMLRMKIAITIVANMHRNGCDGCCFTLNILSPHFFREQFSPLSWGESFFTSTCWGEYLFTSIFWIGCFSPFF